MRMPKRTESAAKQERRTVLYRGGGLGALVQSEYSYQELVGSGYSYEYCTVSLYVSDLPNVTIVLH